MERKDNIIAMADACVQCGFCLPVCPTYAQTGQETHSPRGRIALMRGLAEGRLEADEHWLENVESCLTCGACEKACPSNVSYVELITQTRAELPQTSWSIRMMDIFIRHPWLRPLLRIGRLSPWPAMTRLLPKRLHHRRIAPHTPAQRESVGRVEILSDCMHYLVDTTPIRAASYVLSTFGFDVDCPKQGECCGAWHSHIGSTEKAKQCSRPANPGVPLLALASGCQSHGDNGTQDIVGFLLKHWPEDLVLTPVQGHVGVHLPCTQKDRKGPIALLEKIPGLKVTPLEQGHCCGAGATTVLRAPALSAKVVQKTVDAMSRVPFDWVASTNTGCRLHLGAQKNAPVLVHPIILLAQSLGWTMSS